MASLFGRERELEELRGALRGAADGRGALVLLVGEPGIGKTRLASAFADEAASGGARVTWGRAWEAGGAPDHWPWIEALRPLVAEAAPVDDAAQRERIAPLARLLPALGAAPPGGDPAQERFRVFDAAAAFLAHAARERPLVVVLDDVHAADLGSLAMLHFVARGLHAAGVVLVCTYRDVEARLTAEAGAALARIAREGRYLALGRLGRDEIARWVAAEGRREADADALLATTEGNPLFVAEMLRLSRDAGASAARVPDGVRDVIRTRLEHLSPPARALLDAASVQGRAVDLALAAALAGQELPLARDLAAEAARVDVLVDARDRTAFTHILLREVLYQELPAARRAALHAGLGRALAARDGADEDASLAEAVHHLFAAVPEVPADEAITWARRAAARAGRRLAFDEATEHLARAIELVPPGRDADRCALLLDLSAAQAGAGHTTRGRETAVAAANLARRLGDAEQLAHAALRCGAVFVVAMVDATLIGLLEESLAALPPGDSPLRARLLARLAAAVQPARDPREPIAIARDALAMVDRLADQSARLEVLLGVTSAMAYFADPRERIKLDSELITLAERAGDRVAALRGLMRLVSDYLELGDGAAADLTIDEFDRRTGAAGLAMLRWRAPLFRALRAVMDGRFDDAEALCAESAAIAEQVDDRGAKTSIALHTIGRLWAQRRLDELEARLPVAVELVSRLDATYGRCFRVGMLARVGRAAETRDELDALLGPDSPMPGRPMAVWLADACLALGDRVMAAHLADLLAPMATRHHSWSPAGMIMEGPIGGWVDRLRELAGTASPPAPPATSDARRLELTLEGDVWVVRADVTFRLRDSRGMRILAQLVASPGRELHVTDLVAPPGEAGHVEDAGDALDPQAIAAYKERLEDLRDARAEAEAHNDFARAARACAEIEAIAGELARGVGLGGRARKASATAEKARVNVKKRLDDAIARIGEHSPALAKHLRQAVHTGTFCRYDP